MKAKELQLVTFEQAKKLKELGFNWETEEHYCGSFMQLQVGQKSDRNSDPNRTNCSAPTVALSLKWLRDVKGLVNEVRFYYTSIVHDTYYYQGCFDYKTHKQLSLTSHFETYEEAESALLDEVLILLGKGK